MQHHVDTWTCSMAVERRELIDPRPVYQRGPVWSLAQQQRLIDSILRGYDIPKLYFTRQGASEPFNHDVTDGQQRILSIWAFFGDEYPLGSDSEDLPDYGDLSGLTYSELPAGARDRVKLFKLTVCEILEATESEIRELFLRLQEGASLNPAEKRNAMTGNMRDFVSELATTHPVFGLTKIGEGRFAWHDLAAICTRLEVAQGAADVKATDLRQLYLDHEDFEIEGDDATRVRGTLDYLARVFHLNPDAMKIKWGFVDLYLAVSELLHRRPDVDITAQEESFLLMYESFESRRRAVDDPSDLLSAEAPPDGKLLYNYIDAFQREGGTKSNIAKRHEVYMTLLSRELEPLSRKTTRRRR